MISKIDLQSSPKLVDIRNSLFHSHMWDIILSCYCVWQALRCWVTMCEERSSEGTLRTVMEHDVKYVKFKLKVSALTDLSETNGPAGLS